MMKLGTPVQRREDGVTGKIAAIDGRLGPDDWALIELDTVPEGEQTPQWWRIKDLEERDAG